MRTNATASPSARADRIAARLGDANPGDPGAVASLLLNPVPLQPGEAMFVPAGGVHAYLSGLAGEIMANSDNVLRAGLTSKHVDIDAVLEIDDHVARPPIRIAPEIFAGCTRVVYAPVDDFELSVVSLTGQIDQRLQGAGPRVTIVLEGDLQMRTSSQSAVCGPGAAFFIGANEASWVSGTGTLVQADVP